jgi:hypothetical protein
LKLLLTSEGYLNDIWKFAENFSSNWVWTAGSSSSNVPTSNSGPGGRENPLIWRDSQHNIWLFGGDGVDGPGNVGGDFMQILLI